MGGVKVEQHIPDGIGEHIVRKELIAHSALGKSGASFERDRFGRTTSVQRGEDAAQPTAMGPQLGFVLREPEERGVAPLGCLCAAAREGGAPHLLVADGTRPKIFNLRNGLPSREFNTKHKGSGKGTR